MAMSSQRASVSSKPPTCWNAARVMAMLADTIEYDRLKTGQRREGLFVGAFELMQTTSFVLAPLLVRLIGALVERYGLRTVHKHGHVAELLFTFGLLAIKAVIVSVVMVEPVP